MAHRLFRAVAFPWVRRECTPQEKCCAHNFRTRSYHHHVLGGDTPPCCRRHLVTLLGEVVGALEGAGIECFAFWGTFLGAVRHHGLIPWDRDADLVVPAAQRERALAALRGLTANGRVVRTALRLAPDDLRVELSPRNGMRVDVEVWHEEGDLLVHRLRDERQSFPRAWLTPLAAWPFEGLVLRAPASTQALLAHYGSDCLVRGFRDEQRFGDPRVPLSP